MEDFLRSLGFEDITKEKPITFIDKFPVTFGNPYSITSRWRRKLNGIITEVLIGKERNQIHIIGKSFLGDCYSSFCIQTYICFYQEELEKYFFSNEKKVSELFKRCREVVHITI